MFVELYLSTRLTQPNHKGSDMNDQMHEMTIPGNEGRVTYGLSSCFADIAHGTHSAKVESVVGETNGTVTVNLAFAGLSIPLAPTGGFVGRAVLASTIKPHKVNRYNRITLGIDAHKVTYSLRCNTLEALRRLDAQDAKVCAIEAELLKYDGRKRTPKSDRKVSRLRKILTRLKKGIYL